MKRLPILALSAVLLGACGDDVAGPGADEGNVSVRFRTLTSAAALAPASLHSGAVLTITGSNGTLRIDEAWVIVKEFELEQDDDACSQGTGNRCAEFEAERFLLQLPLDGSTVTAASADVPAGTYHEFDFEVDDLLDDDDDDESAEVAALRAAVRQQFPQWPDDASMRVVGSFTPASGGPARPFTVFLEAEIEVELDLVPPLVVDGSGAALTVDIAPSLWFGRVDGTVLDLSQFDFVATGAVPEFEAELERGFVRVEVDDD